MKKKLIIVFLFLFLLLTNLKSVKSDSTIDVYFFHVSTCSHCQKEKEYLETKDVVIHDYLIDSSDPLDKEAAENLYEYLVDYIKITNPATPFTIIGNKYIIGFNDTIKEEMDKCIDYYSKNECHNYVIDAVNGEDVSFKTMYQDEEMVLPIMGKVNVKNVSLLLLSLVLGFIDGINPCAMWVLIFLLTLLIPTKSRKKILILGLSFILSSAIFYFVFLLGAGFVISKISTIIIFRIIIGILAILFGGFHIYKFIKSIIKKEDGCEVVDENKRITIMDKIKKIVVEKNILIAVLGMVLLAVTVNFIELTCSAGIPVLFIEILEINKVSTLSRLFYIFIYVLFFMIDDIIIFLIAVLSLKIKAISNRISKYSSLIGGLLMLIIGILLIFFPNIIMFNF